MQDKAVVGRCGEEGDENRDEEAGSVQLVRERRRRGDAQGEEDEDGTPGGCGAGDGAGVWSREGETAEASIQDGRKGYTRTHK